MKLPAEIRSITDKKWETKNELISFKLAVSFPVVDHQRLLVVDFWANSTHFKKVWTQPPAKRFRLVIDKQAKALSWIYLDTTGTVRQRRAKLHEFISCGAYIEISDEDEKQLCRYLKSNNDRNHGLYELGTMVDDIADQMTAEWRKKRGSFVDEDYKLFSDEISDDALQWISSLAHNEKTIIYKKGNVRGRCYACGKKVIARSKRFRQYEYAICPECGTKCMCYLEGSAARGSWEVAQFIIPDKNGDVFLMRGFELRRDPDAEYADIRHWIKEIERFAIRGKVVGTWRPTSGGWQMENNKYSEGYDKTWLKNFDEIKQGTPLQYADAKYMKGNIRWKAAAWVYYPIIESLYKAGYTEIARDIERYPKRYNSIKPHAKNLRDCLGVPLKVIDMIISRNAVDGSSLQRIQDLRARGYDGTTLKALFDANVTKDDVDIIAKHTNVMRACEYIIKQDDLNGDKYRRAASEYRDYLRQLEELEDDMTDKSILFPENLSEAHRAASVRIAENRDKIKAKRQAEADMRFAEKMKEFNDYSFVDEKAGLMVVVPKTAGDLRKEGKNLHHCVGSYVNQVEAGKTLILFIRKTDEPKKSYYTMEYRDGKIAQCRTSCNKDYRENGEIVAFVEKWMKYIKKKVGKSA